MNFLRNTRPLLSQIMLRCKAPPAARCYHGHAAPQQLMQDLGSANIKAACRRLSTSPQSFVLRWYHEPRKVAAAAAITLSATVMAACSHYDREIAPCTNRSHLVICSHQEERDLSESAFAEEKMMYLQQNMIVDPRDPDSVRVRLIMERIVHAAHRGLGIADSNDAPMLRVTEKRRRWGKALLASKPHTSHLRGLNWEVILVKDVKLNMKCIPAGKIRVCTGLIDCFKTDEEIAAILAHEVGHIIARHQADITTSRRSPSLLRLFYERRFEIEADYIGILLLGAAGFDPRWAIVTIEKLAKIVGDSVLRNIDPYYPSPKTRLRLLSQPKVMEEAMELYREVTAMEKVIDRYFQ
ncbi:hypothetical protein ACQ4PT_062939 [Festuca glaucescens]